MPCCCSLISIIGVGCIACRRDEDFEHVTLADSDSELESGQFAEFEKVMMQSVCLQTGNVQMCMLAVCTTLVVCRLLLSQLCTS